MQSRIREKRRFKRVKWTRKVALTCFSLILTSCSHTSLKTDELQQVNHQLKNLCLSAEGKGRIKLLSRTTLFSYESVNESKSKIWKLGVDIPLHGSELLALYWGEVAESSSKFKGNFARRIYVTLRNHKDSKQNLKNLRSFANGLGQLIHLNNELVENKKSSCKKGYCEVGKKKLPWKIESGHLFFDYMSRGSETMRFDFSNLTELGPKKLSIYPIESKLSKDNFKVELFFNSCQ